MQHRSADIERRKILAENIKQAVKQEHEVKYNWRVYSHKEIAEAIGVTIRQLERYMIGSSEPTAITIFKFCELMQRDVQSIFLTETEWQSWLHEHSD